MSDSILFKELTLGNLTLPNRVLMAPLTRCRANAANVPSDLMVDYYRQRASAGLIISEATSVSARGFGYPNTPGIFTANHVNGWKAVTSAVHEAGGRIFLQLWHVGRVSHPTYQPDGALPIAPSAIAPKKGKVMTSNGMIDFVTPRALETHEIPGIIAEYEKGARCALEAGFDGVEIHNANGYLLDQFLRDGTNHREDAYGGNIENRARLTLEVVEAVTHIWGSDRVGIRFSPSGVFNDMKDSQPLETFGYVLRKLNPYRLAYVHLTEITGPDRAHGAVDEVPLETLRQQYEGRVIAAGGFTQEKAEEYIQKGIADAIAFGSLFIANPDLPARFKAGAALNKPDVRTFYASGPTGYTDYPALSNA